MPDGTTALMMACKNGHKDVVQFLLNQSAIEANAIALGGWTAFIWACGGGNKDVVKLFLDRKDIELNAKTDITGVLEYTGFILACHWPNKDVVKLLLEYSEERNIELCDDLSGYEFSKEIIDLVELHQEASKD